jgi:hypothetical protein
VTAHVPQDGQIAALGISGTAAAYEIPYSPPQPMFADTLLAFQAFTRPSVSVRIAPDPLGPVNKIVSLMVGGRRVKSVLHPVGAGTKMSIEHESGGYGIQDLFALRSRFWDTRGAGEPEPDLPPRRAPGWYITIDDRVVLYATEAEVNPPSTWTPPLVPLRRRMHRVLTEQLRADADAIAKRLGYHRACAECGWDE